MAGLMGTFSSVTSETVAPGISFTKIYTAREVSAILDACGKLQKDGTLVVMARIRYIG